MLIQNLILKLLIGFIKMKTNLIFLLQLYSFYTFGQVSPELREADRIRIKEANIISSKYGDNIWKGYNDVPFIIILVTDSIEFLIDHPNPSDDYIFLINDEVLDSKIYYLKTQFNPQFLATFPAVNGLSCIVVGTPENTNKNSSEWIITLLHEHFHQYQSTHPGYYENINQLSLSGGDQTGMWMLNYPFPYESIAIKDQFKSFTESLYLSVTSINNKDFEKKLMLYIKERERLKNVMPAADYRYFSFQLWQEGLARHTEYIFLDLLKNYTPSKEISALPDFEPFGALKKKMYDEEMKKLKENNLDQSQRNSFYTVGFAEGILLDKLNKDWRSRYFEDMFYIERYSPVFK
jgi:hypothetical protein